MFAELRTLYALSTIKTMCSLNLKLCINLGLINKSKRDFFLHCLYSLSILWPVMDSKFSFKHLFGLHYTLNCVRKCELK